MRKLTLLAVIGLAVTTAQAELIHHYTFDDADIVGTKGAGDVVGTADATPVGANGGENIETGLPGVFGEAYQFTRDADGSSLEEFENILTAPGGTAPFGSAERTISLWFSQTFDTNGQDKLFGYGTNSGGRAMDISMEAGGIRLRHFGGNITYGGGGFDFDGADAGFHHLAVRVNAGASTFADVDIFLDGVQLNITATGGGGTGVSIDTADSPFGISSSSIVAGFAAFNGFTGLLDDLRIYDSALSDAEILELTLPPGVTAFIWDGGGADNELGTAANWQGDVAPTFSGAAELLVFTGSTRTAPVNNVAGRSAFGLLFDANAAAFTLGGTQGLSVADQISNLSGNAQVINASVQAAGDVSVVCVSDVTLNGVVSGLGGIDKRGDATLNLTNTANSYDGETNVVAGALAIAAPSVLGSTTAGTTIAAGTLQLTAPMTISAEPLTLVGIGSTGETAGQIVAQAGSSEIAVDVTGTGGGNHNLHADAGATLTLSGDFVLAEEGTTQKRLNFGGEGNTVFSGNFVEPVGFNGLLDKNNGAGTLTVTGDAKVNNDVTVIRAGTVVFTTSGTNPVPESSEISVRADATADFSSAGVVALTQEQRLTAETGGIIIGEVTTAAYTQLTPGGFNGGGADQVMVLPDGLTLASGAELTIDVDEVGETNDVINVTGGDFEVTATVTEPIVINMRGVSAAGGPYVVLDWSGASVVGGAPSSNLFVVAGAGAGSTANVVGSTLEVAVADPAVITTIYVSSDESASVEAVVVNQDGDFVNAGNFIPTAPGILTGYPDSVGGQSPIVSPRGLARDNAGNVYVAENDLFGRVMKFDETGAHVASLAEEFTADPGVIPNLPGRPNYLALSPDGSTLFVSLFEKTAEDFVSTEPYAGIATINTATDTVNGNFVVGTPGVLEGPQGIAVVPMMGGGFEIVVADSILGQYVRFSSTGTPLTPLTSTAGNDPNDPDTGFSEALGLAYDSFNKRLLATAQSVRDIFAFTDPFADNLLFDDPSIVKYLENSQFPANAAIGVEFIQNRVVFAHQGNNALRFSPLGTNAVTTLVGGLGGLPFDILVYEDMQYDVNLDGTINGQDLNIMLDCFTGPDNSLRPLDVSPLDFERCDLDTDSDVDMFDLDLLMRAISA